MFTKVNIKVTKTVSNTCTIIFPRLDIMHCGDSVQLVDWSEFSLELIDWPELKHSRKAKRSLDATVKYRHYFPK